MRLNSKQREKRVSVAKVKYRPYLTILRQRLKDFARCGIRPLPDISYDELLDDYFGDDPLDVAPQDLPPYSLISTLGFSTRNRPHRDMSNDIWFQDAECIYSSKDYVYIATRMRDLAHGALPIHRIRASLGDDGGSLSFTLNGRQYVWRIRVNGDWVDSAVFTEFAALLKKRQKELRYTICLEPQYFYIGCWTPSQLRAVRKLTGMQFVWLTKRSNLI